MARLNYNGRNFKAEEERVTLVISVPQKDIRFIRLAVEMKEYQLPAIQRFLEQVEKALPKEANENVID